MNSLHSTTSWSWYWKCSWRDITWLSQSTLVSSHWSRLTFCYRRFSAHRVRYSRIGWSRTFITTVRRKESCLKVWLRRGMLTRQCHSWKKWFRSIKSSRKLWSSPLNFLDQLWAWSKKATRCRLPNLPWNLRSKAHLISYSSTHKRQTSVLALLYSNMRPCA